MIRFDLPGGRVDILEPSNVTIVREFAEELGVEVQVDRLLWVVERLPTTVQHVVHADVEDNLK
ncbi:NUDIX domain-containing protein [Tumebacillus permanentifrigoris]|uniref:Nudix hydrolase domain-containing protein n=1 Tax=Tumebacillus permanentifrigoris TaxID=378543 RepID=A0A316DB79_9BACL|nr:NUDIX domain-containing protein [Tumebacillus permanentifrigoris]PWK14352.1 hypothetical protein C7459_105108 [Tumebacillus permanentifrigoris]